jgi:hypothetical protein
MKTLFIIIIIIIFIVYMFFNRFKYNKKIKGICYFDIDDTLTTSIENNEDIMNECLDNNFAVGIITASSRDIQDICYKNVSVSDWMPNKLCKQFYENNGKMYNSYTTLAGNKKFPSDYPFNETYGFMKGYNMKFGRDSFYPHIPDKAVIIFDDQKNVLDDVKRFNNNFQTVCSHPKCGGDYLSKNTVRNIIKKINNN